jgi:ribose 5-phosphate isomerase B
MKIAIASDHAGYFLKQHIVSYLRNRQLDVKDFGTNNEESVDYPDFVHPLAKSVSVGESELGIVLCGSGNGVNMTVNKYQEIRSALCWIPEIASLARRHNDANVCAIPARFVSKEVALLIVEAFLSEPFEGGRHQKRINKIPIN